MSLGRPIAVTAANLTGRLEACRLTAYRDTKGVWTIGYGSTGPGVHEGLVWTQAQADAALYRDLTTAGLRLQGVVDEPVILGLQQHQYDALLSFVFNLGANKDWTIWRCLNQGHADQVPAQMLRFDKERLADGTVKEVPGLLNRRMAEIAYWKTPDVEAAAAIVAAAPAAPPPSSQTRVADTPPSVAPQKPFSAASITTKAVSCVAACAAGAGSLKDTVAPYAADVPVIQQIVVGLTMLLAGCAVAGLVLHHLQNKARLT